MSTQIEALCARMCVCWKQTPGWIGRWLKQHESRHLVMRELSWVSYSKSLRKCGDLSLCDFSRCCVRRLKLQELEVLTEKYQWHQVGWPINSANFPLQCQVEGHMLRKWYHSPVNYHNSPVKFLSQLWKPTTFFFWEVCVCMCMCLCACIKHTVGKYIEGLW